jgi:NodT family efflux transporter outer membrane factor (OMF) lipoprotein
MVQPKYGVPLIGVLAVLSSWLGACSVGPSFTTPQATIAATWRAQGDPRVSTQTAADSLWWKAFNDPVLDRLVQLAYQQNLPLQIAGLRIVEARAQLGIATGLQFPQVQAILGSATANGLSKNTPIGAFLPNRYYGSYQLGFDAAWEIDFWGKYRRGVESQTAALLASVADYYAALVSLTAEVARTYVQIRTYEVLVQQARDNEKIQEGGLEIAQSRFTQGATSELDPSQATVLLENTRASIPELQINLQQARNALCTLLGQPAGTVDALLVQATGIPKAPAKVAVGMPAEILRRRPDIRSAELAAAAQCARIGVAKAELYPSFSLFGTIGLETSTVGGTTKNLLSSNSLFYTAGPRVNWPFLNYGRLTNAVRVQDALFQQLLVAYRDTVLKAAQEVEDALASYLDAEQEQTFREGAVTAARRAVDLSLIMYREGATDYQRVFDAQRSLLDQEQSLAQTSSIITTSVIALYKALGGGWESHEGQPVVPERTRREMQDRTSWGDLLSEPTAPEPQKNSPPGEHK